MQARCHAELAESLVRPISLKGRVPYFSVASPQEPRLAYSHWFKVPHCGSVHLSSHRLTLIHYSTHMDVKGQKLHIKDEGDDSFHGKLLSYHLLLVS